MITQNYNVLGMNYVKACILFSFNVLIYWQSINYKWIRLFNYFIILYENIVLKQVEVIDFWTIIDPDIKKKDILERRYTTFLAILN